MAAPTVVHRAPEGDSHPLSGTGFEEGDALFTGAKRAEPEERHSRSLLGDDGAGGAPPRTAVDLDAGVVTVVRPSGRRRGARSDPLVPRPIEGPDEAVSGAGLGRCTAQRAAGLLDAFLTASPFRGRHPRHPVEGWWR
ncbi:DUF6191 domain-containing protein [Pseudonocardia kujensis]|uniref:DUF6191 domain-containing protein n=1 Tax=Pseudonocardia kujensis TaxID=1128675 RepID=UPI003555F62C